MKQPDTSRTILPKNIHSMKENRMSKSPLKTPDRNVGKSKNIIVANGIPCYNNINIYTSNLNGKSDINLRQYIFNKTKSGRVSSTHGRSNSSNVSKNN
jgi:hypothetical protein